MSSHRKFLCEVGTFRKSVENNERIVYNSVDDIEPLDNEANESLYDLINGLNPKLVFEYSCGFGVHLYNLARYVGCECVGSTYGPEWHEAALKYLGEQEGIKYITPLGVYDCNADVILIDNDTIKMSNEELSEAIRFSKASNLGNDVTIVVRDSQLEELDGFDTAEQFTFDEAEGEEDGETKWMPGVFVCERKASQFVADIKFPLSYNETESVTFTGSKNIWTEPKPKEDEDE